jgi:hypothetical protein
MGSFSFVEPSPPEMEASVKVVFGFDLRTARADSPVRRRGAFVEATPFGPCPKNQRRSRAFECDHFVGWSGDQFLSELLLEHR